VAALSQLGGWLSIAAFLVLFLVWYVRRWNARRQRFWAPLAPIIEGRARGFRMMGTYQRHEVIAELFPVHDAGPRSPNNSPWFFIISMDSVPDRDRRQRRRTVLEPAGVNWTVRHEEDEGWEIATTSEALRQGLARAGLPSELRQWGTFPTIGYSARPKLISVEEDFPDEMTPERFRSRLDLLVRLAHLNQELHPG
jgi:hypothetical protein